MPLPLTSPIVQDNLSKRRMISLLQKIQKKLFPKKTAAFPGFFEELAFCWAENPQRPLSQLPDFGDTEHGRHRKISQAKHI